MTPRNDEFPYSRYRLSFETEGLLLRQVDVWDQEGTLVKRVLPRKYERIGAYATAMESDVANLRAATHTVFSLRDVKYDTGVSDSVFSLANISKGQ